ncbi:hypothetical protein ACHAWT_000688 [Skeletonema menzelii]
MGKKRNNAAKKKKATKKKQNLSAAFGVTVQKGGTIARNNGVINKNALADGQNAQPRNNKIGSSNATASTSADAAMSTNEQPGTRPSNSNENDEFRRLHASLEERQLALQARQKECQKKKRGRKSQKKGWGKFAHPSTKVEFASATLNLGPKSTEQLINEAADHVAMGMTDIGQSAASSHYAAASADGKSSLAAAAGLNWKMQLSHTNTSMQPSPEQSNPFAALDEDSDSDNEWSEKKADTTPQFHFQPASFSFQSAPAVTQCNQDVDPDL